MVSKIVLASNRETAVLDKTVDSDPVMRDGDVPSKVVGAEERLVAQVAHVISLAKMDFLQKNRKHRHSGVNFATHLMV